MMDYLIFDIATVRYRYNATRTTMSAFAPTGELLSVVDLAPHHSTREAAFLAADAALRSARLLRAATRYALALYNPYSADVCVGPTPETKIYSTRQPLTLTLDGTFAEVSGDVLCVHTDGGVELPLYHATIASTSRALVSHETS